MELKEYLQQKYQGSESFLENVIFSTFGKDNFQSAFDADVLEDEPQLRPLAESTGIGKFIHIGTIELHFDSIEIFDITVTDRVQMDRNRVAIQLLVRRIISNYSSAFMIFHYDDETKWDWRFTFCRKGATNLEGTDSKRYTFLLGPSQSCRTAADNFINLKKKCGNIQTDDIISAFDVEALSNEFFEKYKQHYEGFVEYITGKRYVKTGNKWVETVIHDPHPQMYADFGHDDKLVRDYVKKMMGRIVFLHFLQKKGWMGVSVDKEWGRGDLHFMKKLYDNAKEEQKDDFLDLVLEPLFMALDKNRKDDDYICDTITMGMLKVPYLNGGLFVRDDLDEINTTFPRDMFDNLLEFLYQYNFTINENDPVDAQVGIDPEMLGRIFENLLEDNKDKGAYYTPKEIVKYMCRESLKAYLQTNITDEVTKVKISRFVENYDVTEIGGEQSDLAQLLDKKLIEVKICDPAIGSGAFPMGLLKELFFCRGAIEHFDNAADIKRHIIQNNIYGVDIERGAVDIARLRFWLSLIIDETTPETLPNLDFKFMQGNSLLESYKGIDLSTMAFRKVKYEGLQAEMFGDMLDKYRKQLRDALSDFYNCDEHEKRDALKKKITDNVQEQLREQGMTLNLSDIDLRANDQFFLWHTWFNDVFNRPSKQGFDIVIGNPPYVEAKKLKNIASILKEPYKKVASGTADFSIYFIELGRKLLNDDGCLYFITTNKFFNTGYGKKVREMLCEQTIVSLINFEQVEVFENVLVSSVVLGFNKKMPSVDNIFAYEQFYKLSAKEFMDSFTAKQGQFGIYSQQYLGDEEWSFPDVGRIMLKKHIENGATILSEIEDVKIYRGVTTGYNPAFIIDNIQKEELIKAAPNNTEIIKNMLQGRNIRKWYYNESDENLIFTRRRIEIKKYPFIKNYLQQFFRYLKPKTLDDNTTGRKPGNYKWFEILDNTAYYEEFEKGEKAIWGLTANKWAFAYDDKKHYLPSNGYILTSSTVSVKYILALLNSKLLHYYFGYIGVMTAGGAYTLKAATISVLPFKIAEDLQPYISIVDRILEKKSKNKQSDTSVEETVIDLLVYHLYDLTFDEVLIVDPETPIEREEYQK